MPEQTNNNVSAPKTGNVFKQLHTSQEPQEVIEVVNENSRQTSAQYQVNKMQEEIFRMFEFLENKQYFLPDWR
jgi:hypothetical protein